MKLGRKVSMATREAVHCSLKHGRDACEHGHKWFTMRQQDYTAYADETFVDCRNIQPLRRDDEDTPATETLGFGGRRSLNSRAIEVTKRRLDCCNLLVEEKQGRDKTCVFISNR